MSYNHFSKQPLIASISTISLISMCLDKNTGPQNYMGVNKSILQKKSLVILSINCESVSLHNWVILHHLSSCVIPYYIVSKWAALMIALPQQQSFIAQPQMMAMDI